MPESLVVQRPERPAAQLVLLFHGVGATAQDLVPLARILAAALPGAMVVSVSAPHPSSLGRGQEWFSVVGVSEQSRPGRIAQAMDAFRDTVAHWQRAAGVGPEGTTLVGFSQGAIMSLEAARTEPAIAGRIVSLAGRFATLPQQVAASIRFHFVHGAQDAVIAVDHGIAAAQALEDLGAAVTLDVLPSLGHGIDPRVASLLVDRLTRSAAPAAFLQSASPPEDQRGSV